jgi:hypothetical protein
MEMNQLLGSLGGDCMKICTPSSYDKINLFDSDQRYSKKVNLGLTNGDSPQVPVKVDISKEGIAAYKSYVQKNTVKDDTPLYEVTIDDTNELEMEHFFAMRANRHTLLEDKKGQYSMEDVMKSIVSAYENRYNEIMKAHESGDRKVSYDLAGEASLTLEQDLDGLNRAYDREVSMIKGYIWCLKTSNGDEFFAGIHSDEEEQNTNRYIDTSQKILEKARERLFKLRTSPNYKTGASISILSEIMNSNSYFINETHNIMSHARFFPQQ